MADGVNGPGFASREEAARFHMERMRPRETNLDYQFGPRPVREALPLDDERAFQQAQATEQGQQAAMDKFVTTENPQAGPMVVDPNMDVASLAKAARQGAATAAKPLPQMKSLKEIAMERGHIPRKG